MVLKSIKSKMMLVFGVFILLIIAISSGVSYIKTRSIFTESLLNTAESIAVENGKIISSWIEGHEHQLYAIIDTNNSLNLNGDQKTEFLKSLIRYKNEVSSYYIADSSGNATSVDIDTISGSSQNISTTSYYKTAMKTQESVISTPFIDSRTDEKVISIAVPILDRGISTGIVGVNLKLSYLQDIVNGMKINKKGYGWIIDKGLYTIAHPEKEYLGNITIFEDSNQDLKKLAERIIAQDQNIGSYNSKEGKKILAYNSISNTDWSIAMVLNENDLLSPITVLKENSIIIVLIAIFFSLIITYFISSKIANPILRLNTITREIAAGKLNLDLEVSNRKDEIGSLTRSVHSMFTNLQEMIDKIYQTSDTLLASGKEISSLGDQVERSAEEVGEAIQNVAAGAEEQSAQIEETSNNVNFLINDIQNVNKKTNKLNQSAEGVVNSIKKGNDSLSNAVTMVNKVEKNTAEIGEVIKNLGSSSDEIGNITELINGIAEQTNLLALNAAIEAARAGESGRGFSVVADEIRELAEESANATGQIARRIKQIQKDVSLVVDKMSRNQDTVKQGVILINKTGESFEDIKELVNNLGVIIKGVNSSTTDMRKNSERVQKIMTSIAGVSQEFSNSSEEVASSSEDQLVSIKEIVDSARVLSKIAEELSYTVNKFEL